MFRFAVFGWFVYFGFVSFFTSCCYFGDFVSC